MHLLAFCSAYPLKAFRARSLKTVGISHRPVFSAANKTCQIQMLNDDSREGEYGKPPEDLYEAESDSASEKTVATFQAILDDLAARPEYYLNVSGVLLGMLLSAVVLSATMAALDSIPIVPDFLRMIGLAYLFWFLKKFLFSAGERQRLGDDVDQFVAGIRGQVVNNIRSERLSDSDI